MMGYKPYVNIKSIKMLVYNRKMYLQPWDRKRFPNQDIKEIMD
jgi:hypothetical protein